MSEQVTNCGECRFFDPIDMDQEEGYCRRFAPRPRKAPRDAMTPDPTDVVSWWPVVINEDWCGEAVPK